jgi:hypothetical protein
VPLRISHVIHIEKFRQSREAQRPDNGSAGSPQVLQATCGELVKLRAFFFWVLFLFVGTKKKKNIANSFVGSGLSAYGGLVRVR